MIDNEQERKNNFNNRIIEDYLKCKNLYLDLHFQLNDSDSIGHLFFSQPFRCFLPWVGLNQKYLLKVKFNIQISKMKFAGLNRNSSIFMVVNQLNTP